MLFETDKDRLAQDRAQWILEFTGYDIDQTPTESPYDFIAFRDGKPRALIEFKERDRLWDPLKVDASKIRKLCAAAHRCRLKPIFLICVGGRYLWTVVHTNYPTEMFTRKRNAEARGETADEVFCIPASDFKQL